MVKQVKRTNTIFEMAAKKGAKLSQKKHFASATEMMEMIGLPVSVIDRVLYEPHNIRSTDLAD